MSQLHHTGTVVLARDIYRGRGVLMENTFNSLGKPYVF